MEQYKIVDLSKHPSPGEYVEGDIVTLSSNCEFAPGDRATEYTSDKGEITLKGYRLQLVSSVSESTVQLWPLGSSC